MKTMLRIRTLGAGIAASLLTLAAGAGSAFAADLSQPSYNPPPQSYAAPAWTWTGAYAGLQGGYGWGSGTVSGSGWIGGAYAGYNLQTNQNFVVGIEGDISATTKAHNSWDGTFRGRAGYAWDRNLAYGTAGVAVGGLSDSPNPSATKTGWVAGIGLEHAFADNVTGRVEYRHTDLGAYPSGGSNYTSNDLLVGIGMKF
jgi:outer membrane immunogenic protein